MDDQIQFLDKLRLKEVTAIKKKKKNACMQPDCLSFIDEHPKATLLWKDNKEKKVIMPLK